LTGSSGSEIPSPSSCLLTGPFKKVGLSDLSREVGLSAEVGPVTSCRLTGPLKKVGSSDLSKEVGLSAEVGPVASCRLTGPFKKGGILTGPIRPCRLTNPFKKVGSSAEVGLVTSPALLDLKPASFEVALGTGPAVAHAARARVVTATVWRNFILLE